MKKFVLYGVVPAIVLAALWFLFALNWSYSTGERAGYVQKLSQKGWLCKTWEGELALVSMPGAPLEKFTFTVMDDAVADSINRVIGRRVAFHYEQKVGLPTTCFGDTRYYVTRVTVADDISLSPGVVVQPRAVAPAPQGAASMPAPSSAPTLP